MVDVSGEATPRDVEQIVRLLYEQDTEAFSRGDWSAVEEDFDAGAFVGYEGGGSEGEPWRIGYPTLEDYQDSWLEQSSESRRLLEPDELCAQALAASRIAGIEVRGRHALVRKEFDGWIGPPDDRRRMLWLTYYFLRRPGPGAHHGLRGLPAL
jgi:hypothetical protein